MNWIIINVTDHELCWSETYGWVTDDYDTFSDDEKANMNLPNDGEWEQVHWNIG